MQAKLEELRKLQLPKGHFAITGSGPLGIRRLREINDIDLIVDQGLWDDLVKKYGIIEVKEVKKIVIPGGLIEIFGPESFGMDSSPSVTERIAEADIIDDLPFESLKHNIHFKKMMGREKDFRDLSLIQRYLQKRSGSPQS